MEYAKDIILNIGCKREIGVTKLRNWTSWVKKVGKNNRFIITTLSLLTTLMIADIVLVNAFLQLLSKIN